MSKKPVTFVREATGLVREFSLLDTTLMSVGLYAVMYICIWALTVQMYGFPGSDFRITIILVTILTAFGWGLTYGLLGAIMPRAGGDYVWVSRVLHPVVGFVNNFPFLIIILATFVGSGVVIWGSLTFALSAWLNILGRMIGNPSIIALSANTSSGWIAFILGVIIAIINVGINILPQRPYSVAIKTLFVASMLVYVAPTIGFMTTSHDQYVLMFNDFMAKYYGSGVSYQGIIDLAKTSGLSVPSYDLWGSLLAIPIGFFSYSAFQYVTYAGGEVKRPERNLTNSMILAIFIGLAVTLIIWQVMVDTVGMPFITAAAYLAWNGQYPIPFGVTPMAFAAPIYPDVSVITVTFLSMFVLSGFFCVTPTLLATSRNLFAWSFDRVAPEWLSSIDERTHRPLKALAVLLVLVIISLAFNAFIPWLTTLYNMIILIFINAMIVSLTAIVLPFVKKDLFNMAPANARKKIAGVPLLSIVGLVTFLSMLWAAVATLLNPATSGPTQPGAFALVIALYVIALIWYYVAKWKRAKEGMDLSIIFREIPPE